MTKLPVLALVLIAAGATAADSKKDLDKALAGRVAGAPVDCISTFSTDGPQVIDERTVLYRSGRRVYVNTLEAACPSLDWDKVLIVELHGSQICRNDHFRVLARGTTIPGPTCLFGKFAPYDKPKS
ncbi:MAG: DUF6491 family protein [Sphingomonas sp.]